MILDYSYLQEGIQAYRAGQLSIGQLHKRMHSPSDSDGDYYTYMVIEEEFYRMLERAPDVTSNDPEISEMLAELEAYIALWQPEQVIPLEGGTTPTLALSPVVLSSVLVFNRELVGVHDNSVGVYLDPRTLSLDLPVYRQRSQLNF